MKKWGFIAFAFLISSGVWAQKLSWGIMGGANFGGPLGKVDSAEGKPAIGFDAGLTGSYQLSERFSLNSMLFYSRKGASYSQFYTRDTIVEVEIQGTKGTVPTFYDADVSGTIVLHYLKLPLLLSYKSKSDFFMELGPYASYLLRGRDSGDLYIEIGEDGFITDENSFNSTKAFHSVDYGVVFMSGYEFNFGMDLYFKASRGFQPIYKSEYFSSQGQKNVRLYNTFVSVGLRYDLSQFFTFDSAS